MDQGTRTWEFELWSSNGTRLADISGLIEGKRLVLARNQPEELYFSIDLYRWERFCASINADPRTVLEPYQTDVKVKRNGQYLYGLQVIAARFGLSGNSSSSTGSIGNAAGSFNPVMNVSCTGYLNLFKDRYASITYAGLESTTIATSLIQLTQAQANGSVGVTIGSQYATGKARDRTYKLDNIKQAIQNLTQLVDGNFDFYFTHDKVFRTVQSIGSVRSDLSIVIGGDSSNIIGFDMDRSATTLYNRIIAQGDDVGGTQLTSIANDPTSQLANYLREDPRQYNSVSMQGTLDDNAASDLEQSKDVLELPQVTITGAELRGKPWLSVGDRIPVSAPYFATLRSLEALYRTERIEVSIDDQDFEASIALSFDRLPSGRVVSRSDRLTDDLPLTAIARLRSDLNELRNG